MRNLRAPCLVLMLACLQQASLAFLQFPGKRAARFQRTMFMAGPSDKDQSQKKGDKDMDLATKASWYGVEAFGKVFGKKSQASPKDAPKEDVSVTYSMDSSPSSLEETIQRIQADNDREYFLSGQVDKLIYDENCVFADPFVSFEGRDRFVDNLANLGSFITAYEARPLDYREEDNAVETKFMVKLQLNLPWDPVLAWPWGVRCEIDPSTNLVILHKESWQIEPWEGVKQIFRKSTVKVKGGKKS